MLINKLLCYLKIFYYTYLSKSVSLNYSPEDISVEVTNVCNFKCAFCAQSSPQHFENIPRKFLSTTEAKIILKKFREGGVKTKVIHWTLDGEPFLNPEFSQICASALEFGFNNHYFATNGALITPERLLTFPSDNVSYKLTIDFSADKEGFEKYRGFNGSWEVIVENIEKICAQPALSHFTIFITDISKYWIRDQDRLQLLHAKLKNMFCSDKVRIIGFRQFHNMTGYLGVIKNKENAKYHICPYPWVSVSVASNGDVVACCRDLEHKTVLGNLLKQELREIWNGQRFKALRHSLIKKENNRFGACLECDMPYDASKWSIKNIVKFLKYRLQA